MPRLRHPGMRAAFDRPPTNDDEVLAALVRVFPQGYPACWASPAATAEVSRRRRKLVA